MSLFSKLCFVLRTDGGIYLINAFKNKIFSQFIQRRFNFGLGLLIHHDADLRGLQCAGIGNNFSVGRRARIEIIRFHNGIHFSPELIIGDNVSIQDDVHIGCIEKIIIGDGVLIASKVYISDHNHGNYSGSHQDEPTTEPRLRLVTHNPVTIGRNVWIGEMVSILPGVSIGEGTIIGANSVVVSDLPPNCIAVGVPARIIKTFDVSVLNWKKV